MCIRDSSTLDVTFAVRRANDVNITRAEMIPDDKRRWALYIKPENKEGYSVYPDKEDVNRFFSTLKQSMDNIEKVRMELAHKYYALAEVQPTLKVDLFSTEAQDIDLNRIQRVSVYKTKQGETQCVATIDGQKTVSYTHLDVYKRQCSDNAAGWARLPGCSWECCSSATTRVFSARHRRRVCRGRRHRHSLRRSRPKAAE